MMPLRKLFYILLVFLGLFISNIAICQNEENDTTLSDFIKNITIDDLLQLQQSKSYFKFQTSYLSNYVYAGRKDTIGMPYITPSLEYTHKSGFFISTALGLLAKQKMSYDFLSIDAGFSFDTSKRWGFGLFANKLFYSSTSSNVQSDVKFSLGGSATYYNNWFNTSANLSAMFGNTTDFSLVLGIDKSFDWGDNKTYSLTLAPNISSYWGTTGYYQSYKSKIRKRTQGQANPQLQNINIIVTSPRKFQLLSIDFSLPLYFDKEKWGVFITPTYSIPVNPVVTSIKAETQRGGVLILPQFGIPGNITENISNTFFVDLGVYIKF